MDLEHLRTSKLSKITAVYLAMMIMFESIAPMAAYALTGGPSQPEFNSFTPVETNDMVDLSSGDYSYNIPLMDVGGYPINISYQSGVSMDQEASMVGLGWNLNVGQISRNVRGIPDDFDGDQGDYLEYENEMKDNISRGANLNVDIKFKGKEKKELKAIKKKGAENATPVKGKFVNFKKPSMGFGIGVTHNNYTGTSFDMSKSIGYGGVSFGALDISGSKSVSASALHGATVTNSISAGISASFGDKIQTDIGLGVSVGNSQNSRTGVMTKTVSKSLNFSQSKITKTEEVQANGDTHYFEEKQGLGIGSGSNSTSISFANTSYTPTQTLEFSTKSQTYKFGAGGTIGFFYVGGSIMAHETVQTITNRYDKVKAYGYINADKIIKKTKDYQAIDGVLDLNRDNDRAVSMNTNILPMVNNTFDLYSIQGQGVSGMFRGYRNTVSYNSNRNTGSKSIGKVFGVEVGLGTSFSMSTDYKHSKSGNSTGAWLTQNQVVDLVDSEHKLGFHYDHEPYYFKTIGGLSRDEEAVADLEETFGLYKPFRYDIQGAKLKRILSLDIVNTNGGERQRFEKAFKRSGSRKRRSTNIQPIYVNETSKDLLIKANPYAKGHHIAGYKILKPDGQLYVFGETAYNINKDEITFDVSETSKDKSKISPKDGLIQLSNTDGRGQGSKYSDQYYNRTITPAYAHTYLLTSVLSSDYQDLTNNGITDDDLGNFTKISYKKIANQYQWRVPFEENKAVYNEGLKSSELDDKGNIIRGNKEIKYVSKIENKTHIAIFNYTEREDALGSGTKDNKQQKLSSITLYHKAAYLLGKDDLSKVTPIKTVYFEYDYSLCPGVPNNEQKTVNDLGTGKLTLKKVYFTYANSNLGKYTPYVFDYSAFNPSYQIKAYDSWANYKPYNINHPEKDVLSTSSTGPLTSDEFPYTEQDPTKQNEYAQSWCLTAIGLPSGGTIKFDIESDDYAYVQNKKVMKMYQVLGLDEEGVDFDKKLYYNEDDKTEQKKYLWIKVPEKFDQQEEGDLQKFKDLYIQDLMDKPIYFRYLVNMNGYNTSHYDYVSGYLKINQMGAFKFRPSNDGTAVAIPIASQKMEGGYLGGADVNPIAKSGWYFARKYLNALAYTGNEVQKVDDFMSAIEGMKKSIGAMSEIANGPNGFLYNRNCASMFVPEKSWIRLYMGANNKLGGGLRVSKVSIKDNWSSSVNSGTDMVYGQKYTYKVNESQSSGVATYEPIGSKENPFVEPIYDNDEALVAPKSENFVEAPIGESFFPSPKITYSSVRVESINGDTNIISSHGTGYTVNEFYTTKDFPTLTDYTEVQKYYDKNANNTLISMLTNVRTEEELTLSQGFLIHTNDMDGKQKAIKSFNTDGELVSSTEYLYKSKKNEKDGIEYNTLDNRLTFINEEGKILRNQTAGVEFEIMNDFRTTSSYSQVNGYNGSYFIIPGFWLPIPFVIPDYSREDSRLKMASTTKLVNSQGVLEKVVTYQDGITTETTNLAWDQNTGDVLLTETVYGQNEKKYDLKFPAYWNYKGMDAAYKNLGLKGELTETNGKFYDTYSLLKPGDIIKYFNEDRTSYNLFWVVSKNPLNNEIVLNNYAGARPKAINEDNELDQFSKVNFEIYSSSNKNILSSLMATVTMAKNPLLIRTNANLLVSNISESFSYSDLQILNATATIYKEEWNDQNAFSLEKFKPVSSAAKDMKDYFIAKFNPFVHNQKGNWRASDQMVYLSSRASNYTSNNITNSSLYNKSGYYKDFIPYYNFNIATGLWDLPISKSKWKKVSTVTRYNPYGQEIENVDPLGRYSSAMYGYENLLPTAVSSNAKYQEIGFDNFEDYYKKDDQYSKTEKHFSFIPISVNSSLGINENESHTGKKSIELLPKSTVEMTKKFHKQDFIVGNDKVSYNIFENIKLLKSSNSPLTTHKLDLDVLKNDTFGYDGAAQVGAFQLVNGSIIDHDVINDISINKNGTLDNPYDDKIVIDINAEKAEQYFPTGGVYTFQYKLKNSGSITGQPKELIGRVTVEFIGSVNINRSTYNLSEFITNPAIYNNNVFSFDLAFAMKTKNNQLIYKNIKGTPTLIAPLLTNIQQDYTNYLGYGFNKFNYTSSDNKNMYIYENVISNEELKDIDVISHDDITASFYDFSQREDLYIIKQKQRIPNSPMVDPDYIDLVGLKFIRIKITKDALLAKPFLLSYNYNQFNDESPNKRINNLYNSFINFIYKENE